MMRFAQILLDTAGQRLLMPLAILISLIIAAGLAGLTQPGL